MPDRRLWASVQLNRANASSQISFCWQGGLPAEALAGDNKLSCSKQAKVKWAADSYTILDWHGRALLLSGTPHTHAGMAC